MFEFHCFMKELPHEIGCNPTITCRMLNFIKPIERALLDEENFFEDVQKFFIKCCIKKIVSRYFFRCLDGIIEKMRCF